MLRRTRLCGANRTGRPTKKTKSLVSTLLRLISGGAPYEMCCQAVGITRETFYDWRRSDPAFAERVNSEADRGSLGHLKKIERHGQKDWRPLSWMLERQHPQHFAREALLNVTAQAVVNNGGLHHDQMVVVSDLEFVGLKRHPSYEYGPGFVREAEQVPPELNGTLERKDENIIVTSESKARAKAGRFAKIRARTEALVEARRVDVGKDGAQTETPLSPQPNH
jgi:hypothetical protein